MSFEAQSPSVPLRRSRTDTIPYGYITRPEPQPAEDSPTSAARPAADQTLRNFRPIRPNRGFQSPPESILAGWIFWPTFFLFLSMAMYSLYRLDHLYR